MYVPRHFAETERVRLHALVRAHGFATLVSVLDGEPFATHVPLLLDAERGPNGTLLGHVARTNPHWRGFDGRAPALAIFHGPHAYVSPRWYRAADQVPTWNYEVVHATGAPRVVEDPAALRALLARLAAQYEAGAVAPWNPASLPERVADGLQRAIVAFELPIERLEGKRKLSQNKAPADRAGVVAGLRAEGDPASLAVAAAMEAGLQAPEGRAQRAAGERSRQQAPEGRAQRAAGERSHQQAPEGRAQRAAGERSRRDAGA